MHFGFQRKNFEATSLEARKQWLAKIDKTMYPNIIINSYIWLEHWTMMWICFYQEKSNRIIPFIYIRLICSEQKDYKEVSKHYQQKLVDRDYNSIFIANEFSSVARIERKAALVRKSKNYKEVTAWLVYYNPRLPSLNEFNRQTLPGWTNAWMRWRGFFTSL